MKNSLPAIGTVRDCFIVTSYHPSNCLRGICDRILSEEPNLINLHQIDFQPKEFQRPKWGLLFLNSNNYSRNFLQKMTVQPKYLLQFYMVTYNIKWLQNYFTPNFYWNIVVFFNVLTIKNTFHWSILALVHLKQLEIRSGLFTNP